MMRAISNDKEAVVHYGDADFAIMKPGSYVMCAVTGRKIPLIELRYWSPEHQEAYVDAEAALVRFKQNNESS